MKKFLTLLAALLMLAMGLPSQAATTTSGSFTKYTMYGQTVELYPAMLTATGPHTATSTYLGAPISNVTGDIDSIAFGYVATDQTGTSPTLQPALYASFTATGNYFPVRYYVAGTGYSLSAAAVDISTASTTNVQAGSDSSLYNAGKLPAYPYYKVGAVIGGSSSPGWSGTMWAAVRRKSVGSRL